MVCCESTVRPRNDDLVIQCDGDFVTIGAMAYQLASRTWFPLADKPGWGIRASTRLLKTFSREFHQRLTCPQSCRHTLPKVQLILVR